MKRYLKLAAAVVLLFTLVSIPVRNARAEEPGYKFKVHNTTKDKITKLLASEDGKSIAPSTSARRELLRARP
jgi:hypothetical protein